MQNNSTTKTAHNLSLGQNVVQPGSLQLQLVSKIFDLKSVTVAALSNINLLIEPGEFVAIMGYSGSGKTTLLNILGLLDSPSSGEYIIDGISTANMSQSERAILRKEKFGIVFQNYNLLNRYTVEQNIELALAYQRIGSKTARKLAHDLLRQLNLLDKAKVYPQQLSGGQAQRIAIARALMNNPPVILADEPTGNLDHAATQEIVQLLKTLNESGTTIVMVTHSEEVAKTAHRVLHMKSGHIVSEGKE